MWRQVILQEGLVDGGRDLLDPRRSWPQLHPVTTDRHQDARYDVFLGSVTSPASSEAQAGQELRHAPEGPIRQLVDVDPVRVVDKVPEIMLVVEVRHRPQAPGPPAGGPSQGNHMRVEPPLRRADCTRASPPDPLASGKGSRAMGSSRQFAALHGCQLVLSLSPRWRRWAVTTVVVRSESRRHFVRPRSPATIPQRPVSGLAGRADVPWLLIALRRLLLHVGRRLRVRLVPTRARQRKPDLLQRLRQEAALQHRPAAKQARKVGAFVHRAAKQLHRGDEIGAGKGHGFARGRLRES